MYDEKLSKNVITHLKVAPLIMLLFGYWMFSSNQLLWARLDGERSLAVSHFA